MADDGGIDVSTFTPEQQAALQSQIEPQGVDPVDTMDAAQLAELSVQTKGEFDPIAWADENQARAFEPATLQKLSDARDIITSRGLGGFVLGDIGAVQSVKEGKPVEAAIKVVKPVAETVGNIAKWFGNTIINTPGKLGAAGLSAAVGDDPAITSQLLKEAAKSSAETVAGVESAMFGLASTAKKLAPAAQPSIDPNDPAAQVGKSAIPAPRGAPVTKAYVAPPELAAAQADANKKKAFLSDLGLFQQNKSISTGQGEFAQTVGTSAEELAKIGVVLDPEIIAERASGDPFAFYAFGKGFQAITPAGKVLATIPGVAQLGAAARGLGSKGFTWAATTGIDLTGKAIGKTMSGAGAVAKVGAGATSVAGAVTGAVTGLAKGGPINLAARSLDATANVLKSSGTAISEFGKRIATEAGPVGSYTQLARDVIQSVPGVVGAVGKGAGIDLGFAAAVSETPQETEAMATFGTTFGALHGVAGAGRRIVQGQALGARPWGTTEKVKPYGSFSELDAANAKAEQIHTPGVVQRADAIRAFSAKLPGGVEAYLMPDSVAFESFLVNDYVRKNGVAPTGDALAAIKQNAQTRGMFSAEMRDDAGQQRKVIILNEVDAAPHESMHAIQDVLGETSNQVVDALVRETYAGEWEAIGEQYARRLAPGDARPWRDVISERTNFPNADVYLARELAAENFDVAFKNKGGDFGRGNTLPEKLARIAARTAVFFGGDPYAGAQTQGLRVQPKAGVTEAVKEQAELAKITPPVIPAAPVAPLVQPRAATPAPAKPTIPTPATSAATGVSPDAKAAQAWAAGKNDPRLVNIVNSIVANQVKSGPGEAAPVRLKYLSVAGEEGSTRTPRRSEQEAAYLAEALGAMPAETRALVEKTHAHVRFETVKKGAEMQSIGYSLEKLVENAQRAARWMSENPEAAKLSPYAIEGTGFSADGWKNLVADIQTYTENQQAGGQGSGKPLALPANAEALKISVPPAQTANLVPMEQAKADFINTIMGFKLPETTRVSRAGGTPGNIVGQEIAKANEQPFVQPRVSAPAVERAGGKEFPGFPGKTIQEVNPLRRQLEAAGFPVNELTEVVERVNLKNLESVTAAPEVAFRPGVTDTIRAGFLPPAEKPRWLVKGQKGGLKTQAEFEGADMAEARRKAEAQGYRVSAVERTNPIELRTQLLPPEQEANQVEKLSQKELQGWSAAQVGGYTATAHRVGQEAPSQAFVDSLKSRAEQFKAEAIAGIRNHDFDASMTSSTKAQFFREAWEAATGTGSAGDRLRVAEPGYAPPFPEGEKAQFSPKVDEKSYESLIKGMRVASSLQYDYRRVANRMNAGMTSEEFREMPYEDKKIVYDIAEHLKEKKNYSFDTFSPKYEGVPKTEAAVREVLPQGAEAVGLTDPARYQEFLALSPELFKSEEFTRTLIEQAPIEKFQKVGGTEAVKEVLGRMSAGETLDELYKSLPYEKWPIVVNAVRQWWQKAHPEDFSTMEEVMRDVRRSLAGRYGEKMAGDIIDYGEKKLGKTQFSPKAKELEKIKSGELFGQTFNPDGTVWSSPKNAKLDVVTLASTNLPKEQLTQESFQKAVAPYSEILKKPGIVTGVFAFEKEGVPFVSIDINAMVPQEFRKNSTDFASKNNQISIWDSVKSEEVKTGGTGETVLKSADEIGMVADLLTSGKPVEFASEAKSQFSPKEADPYAKYNVDYDAAVAKRKAAGGKSGLTGWITPDNKFTPLESNYHEQYLAENSAKLNKKFGTKFSDKPDVEERQQALDRGFVRMRMQGGTLHVESGQAGWTKAARDKVFETVADNLDAIDQIQISILDKDGIVKRQGHERLMDYDSDAEKLDHIPLISDAK